MFRPSPCYGTPIHRTRTCCGLLSFLCVEKYTDYATQDARCSEGLACVARIGYLAELKYVHLLELPCRVGSSVPIAAVHLQWQLFWLEPRLNTLFAARPRVEVVGATIFGFLYCMPIFTVFLKRSVLKPSCVRIRMAGRRMLLSSG